MKITIMLVIILMPFVSYAASDFICAETMQALKTTSDEISELNKKIKDIELIYDAKYPLYILCWSDSSDKCSARYEELISTVSVHKEYAKELSYKIKQLSDIQKKLDEHCSKKNTEKQSEMMKTFEKRFKQK